VRESSGLAWLRWWTRLDLATHSFQTQRHRSHSPNST